MTTFLLLALPWIPYVATRALRARQARPLRTDHSDEAPAEPLSAALTDSVRQDGPSWTALDDRQLTRLLANSAPPDAPPNRRPE
jgi:hypothetical protein